MSAKKIISTKQKKYLWRLLFILAAVALLVPVIVMATAYLRSQYYIEDNKVTFVCDGQIVGEFDKTASIAYGRSATNEKDIKCIFHIEILAKKVRSINPATLSNLGYDLKCRNIKVGSVVDPGVVHITSPMYRKDIYGNILGSRGCYFLLLVK